MIQPYTFTHQAMATEFEIVIAQPDITHGQAQNAANEIFQDIDRLEEELSRFRPGSDIWNLNQLSKGQTMSLHLSTWDCLNLAKVTHQSTAGALDVTIGKLTQLWRNPDKTQRTPTSQQVTEARKEVGDTWYELIPDGLQVRVLTTGLEFDLGAIGKGYALDQAMRILDDWGIHTVLLSAGESTILALGSVDEQDLGWPIQLRTYPPSTHWLKNEALSCSGFEHQGQHLMNPRTGYPVPLNRNRTYLSAPTAALSDALSTAFAIMEPQEIADFCTKYPQVKWLSCSDDQA
jgi:thiamine biosynthesis lipoprotein